MSVTTGQKRGAAPASGMTDRGSCGCGGTRSAGAPPTDDPCCGLAAPERPVFFCGQLLRDNDLKLGFDYGRQLARLRNRELFGAGVVCGLQLEVDVRPDHTKTIIVRPGLAFDGCGREVVVPEAMAFDVIARLKKMQVILGLPTSTVPPKNGEVTFAKETSPTQSFQVVLRYAQSFDDYTTPFLTDCDPAPQACQPTRIRETFCLDLLDDALARPDAIERIAARIAESVSLLVEGRFWKLLSDNASYLAGLISANTPPATEFDKAKALFESLRLALSDYLRSNRDRYNGDTDDRLSSIKFPDATSVNYQVPFRELLGLAWRYVVSRYRVAVLPACDDGPHADSIRLGTVEVRGDAVVGVCECPRDQVLSPNHLVEFVHATLAAGDDCRADENGSPKDSKNAASTPRIHCANTELDVVNLVSELALNPKAIASTATNAVIAIDRIRASLTTAFDFTAPHRFEPSMLDGYTQDDAKKKLVAYLMTFGISEDDAKNKILVGNLPAEPALPHEAIRRVGLGSPNDRFQLYVDDVDQANSLVRDAFASRQPVELLQPEEKALLDKAIKAASDVAAVGTRITDIQKDITDLRTAETQLQTDNIKINTEITDVDKKIGELLDSVNKILSDQLKPLTDDVKQHGVDIKKLMDKVFPGP